MCTSKKDSESEWLAKDNPKTNPITVKPETVSRVAELFWVPLPYCSPCGCPFPIKSLALSDMCLLRQFTSECSTGAQFRALEGVSLPATVPPDVEHPLCSQESVTCKDVVVSFIQKDQPCLVMLETSVICGWDCHYLIENHPEQLGQSQLSSPLPLLRLTFTWRTFSINKFYFKLALKEKTLLRQAQMNK